MSHGFELAEEAKKLQTQDSTDDKANDNPSTDDPGASQKQINSGEKESKTRLAPDVVPETQNHVADVMNPQKEHQEAEDPYDYESENSEDENDPILAEDDNADDVDESF